MPEDTQRNEDARNDEDGAQAGQDAAAGQAGGDTPAVPRAGGAAAGGGGRGQRSGGRSGRSGAGQGGRSPSPRRFRFKLPRRGPASAVIQATDVGQARAMVAARIKSALPPGTEVWPEDDPGDRYVEPAPDAEG